MSPHKIRQFLRSVLNKENKETNFEVLTTSDYQISDCGDKDRKLCIIVVENPFLTLQDFEEAAFELQNLFSNDPIKFIYLNNSVIDENFFTVNNLDFVEDNSILLYKGKF